MKDHTETKSIEHTFTECFDYEFQTASDKLEEIEIRKKKMNKIIK